MLVQLGAVTGGEGEGGGRERERAEAVPDELAGAAVPVGCHLSKKPNEASLCSDGASGR